MPEAAPDKALPGTPPAAPRIDVQRARQLAYSETQALMLDERSRRQKAAKIAAVVQHFLGRDDLTGLRLLDIGCSGGLVADELSRAGAQVVGVDIDEPGVTKAHRRFGDHITFALADSEELPLPSSSADVVICNHVYEHVVDPHRLFAEMRRVLAPGGVLYLGLGNRLGVMEPHYRLPFLSWLPPALADRYVRAFGRADHYHERFSTRPGLRRLTAGLTVWDYTFAVMSDPARFAAGDVVPGPVARLPEPALRALTPLIPTYLWVATVGDSHPAGPPLPVAPSRVSAR